MSGTASACAEAAGGAAFPWGVILGAVAALVGAFGAAALTNRFNARLKELDFWEARRASQRAERREVYRRVLSHAVYLRELWEAVADFSAVDFDPIAALRDAKAPANRAERRSLAADLELVRADGAADTLRRFWAAADQCRLAFVNEMQKAGIETSEDAAGKGPLVRGARSAVNNGLGAVTDCYEELRDLMRDDAYPEEGPHPTMRLRDLFRRRKTPDP